MGSLLRDLPSFKPDTFSELKPSERPMSQSVRGSYVATHDTQPPPEGGVCVPLNCGPEASRVSRRWVRGNPKVLSEPLRAVLVAHPYAVITTEHTNMLIRHFCQIGMKQEAAHQQAAKRREQELAREAQPLNATAEHAPHAKFARRSIDDRPAPR